MTRLFIPAMVDELQKIARTRLVKEWQSLNAAGNQAGADAVAQASGNLGLKPRFLKNLSGGGQEAAVDLTMGVPRQGGGDVSGYVAKKLYKPDSFVSRGEQTSELLRQKQHYTDTARALSPEARKIVPAMYGHQEIQGPQGQLRHVSEHEYVPGVQSLKASPTRIEDVAHVEQHFTKPMKAKDMRVGDVGFLNEERKITGNYSNIAHSPQGPKVLDFIPQGRDRNVLMDNKGTVIYSQYDNKSSNYGGHNMNELRREVHRPGSAPSVPRAAALKVKAPPTGFVQGLSEVSQQATPVISRAATGGASAASALGQTATKQTPRVASNVARSFGSLSAPFSAAAKPGLLSSLSMPFKSLATKAVHAG